MRVISGSSKGRRLKIRGGRIRPTSGKARAAIFNILAGGLDDAAVLDLFAGTGALGIEALSRGAFSAVFVDSGREAARVIRENLEATGMAERSRVIVKRAVPALKLLSAEGARFDLVFMDPPYDRSGDGKAPELLTTLGLLREGAVVVMEHDSSTELSQTYGDLVRYDHRRYGGTAVSFYRKGGE